MHVRFTSSFWAPAPGAPPWPRSRHTTHRRCCGRAIRTPSRRSTSGDATADISATVSFRTGYAPQRTLPKLPTKPMFWWWACPRTRCARRSNRSPTDCARGCRSCHSRRASNLERVCDRPRWYPSACPGIPSDCCPDRTSPVRSPTARLRRRSSRCRTTPWPRHFNRCSRPRYSGCIATPMCSGANSVAYSRTSLRSPQAWPKDSGWATIHARWSSLAVSQR